jgi:Glycosyl transferase family 2
VRIHTRCQYYLSDAFAIGVPWEYRRPGLQAYAETPTWSVDPKPMMPEVSAIIPTYNRRAMVCEAVGSVLAQRGATFELIVVDDGSSDGSAADLERIAAVHRDLMRVERTEHRGVAAARNRGIALARAPLIAFLDSDDLWAPDKLACQLAYVRAHPQYAISQTAELWMRNGQRINPARRHQKRAGDIFMESLRTCLVSPSAAIVQTDLIRALGGFDEIMTAAEDYDLWLRILVDHEVGLLDEPLVTRRAGHADQLSAATPAIDRFRILALAKLLADQRVAGARRVAAAEVLAEKCGIYAKGLSRRGLARDGALYERAAADALACWSRADDPSLADAIAAMSSHLGAAQSASATLSAARFPPGDLR